MFPPLIIRFDTPLDRRLKPKGQTGSQSGAAAATAARRLARSSVTVFALVSLQAAHEWTDAHGTKKKK